jgi:hypothetical protein
LPEMRRSCSGWIDFYVQRDELSCVIARLGRAIR